MFYIFTIIILWFMLGIFEVIFYDEVFLRKKDIWYKKIIKSFFIGGPILFILYMIYNMYIYLERW